MTLASMTGFARADGADGDWRWTVEARSVNGRSLEVRVRIPPGFDALERTARETAQARLTRGQVNVAITLQRVEGRGALRINTDALDRYLVLAADLVSQGHAVTATVDGLLSLRGVIETEDAEPDAAACAIAEAGVARTLVQALDALATARAAEGAALAPVLAGLVDRIEALVADAEVQAADQPAALKARFVERLVDLLAEVSVPEARLVQEAAVLAAKADVREELDRLTSHVGAARALLADATAAGRKLDFLTQEFMREANTLCAKSGSIPLTRTGLALKAVVDQLREQVQNVE